MSRVTGVPQGLATCVRPGWRCHPGGFESAARREVRARPDTHNNPPPPPPANRAHTHTHTHTPQGTLYPDVIESCPPPGSGQKHSHTIKSHHNVGGLPKDLQFKLIEPFRELFKDEVRS
jgi:hypothetical protein